MSDNWQDNPRMKAAALWGVSTNQAYSVADRLAAADQALQLLFEHLDADRIEAQERTDGDQGGVTGE